MNDARSMDQVFRILRAQVPGQHPEITGDTVSTWLARLQWVPAATLVEAATTWGAMQFPTLGEFATHCDAVGRRIAHEDAERYRAGHDDLVACPECGTGDGWVPEEASRREGYDVPVRPCSRCNPRGFFLWRNGHYVRDHTCAMCRARVKGNLEPLAEAMRAGPGRPIEATATVGPGDDF